MPDPPAFSVTTGTAVDPVGTREWFGFVDLHAHGSNPVRIESVRLVDIPSGLKVDGTYAVSYQEEANRPGAKRGYIGSMNQADVDKGHPGLRLHPLTDILLTPGAKSAWYIVIIVEAERYGEFRTSGVEVSYSVGDSRGSQDFQFRLVVRSGPTHGSRSP